MKYHSKYATLTYQIGVLEVIATSLNGVTFTFLVCVLIDNLNNKWKIEKINYSCKIQKIAVNKMFLRNFIC